MRFIHTGDIHLGAIPDYSKPWSKQREKAIWNSFKDVVKEAGKTDFLLIAGDLFHRAPRIEELKEVNDMFEQISPVPVIIIAGNHDFYCNGKGYDVFSWAKNVYFLKNEELSVLTLHPLPVSIYGLSYHSSEITSPLYTEQVIPPDSNFHILLAHGGDSTHIPIDYKQLSEDCGYDYVALGHIHIPKIASKNKKIAYCGSLEPLDYTEVGEHGYIIGEISDDYHLKLKFQKHAKTEYKRIEIKLNLDSTLFQIRDRIEEAIEKEGYEHIYHLVFTGYKPLTLNLSLSQFEDLGQICTLTDKSEEALDYKKLRKEHKMDLLGAYLEEFSDILDAEEFIDTPKNRIRKKAMIYGVKALLTSLEGKEK